MRKNISFASVYFFGYFPYETKEKTNIVVRFYKNGEIRCFVLAMTDKCCYNVDVLGKYGGNQSLYLYMGQKASPIG